MDVPGIGGADAALQSASHRGYEAMLLAIIVLACLALVGVLIRWLMKSQDHRLKEAKEREDRLAGRVTDLERFVETTMLEQVKACTQAINSNTMAVETLNKALDKRPCMLDHEKQIMLINAIATETASKAAEKLEE